MFNHLFSKCWKILNTFFLEIFQGNFQDEGFDLRNLIPYKDTPMPPPEETQQIVELRAQKQELLRINEAKNNQMLQIMRHLRLLIQDINIDAPLRPDVR